MRVGLTSGHGEAVRRAAIELVGSDCFVAKPYRQVELAHRIDALLARNRGAAH
jgi:DNA-binding response OmpR family regulator